MANYIKVTNMPPKVGVIAMMVWWLFLDKIGAPGWAYGVVYSFYGTCALHSIYRICTYKGVDLLEKK